jgi:hypothetical protein
MLYIVVQIPPIHTYQQSLHNQHSHPSSQIRYYLPPGSPRHINTIRKKEPILLRTTKLTPLPPPRKRRLVNRDSPCFMLAIALHRTKAHLRLLVSPHKPRIQLPPFSHRLRAYLFKPARPHRLPAAFEVEHVGSSVDEGVGSHSSFGEYRVEGEERAACGEGGGWRGRRSRGLGLCWDGVCHL